MPGLRGFAWHKTHQLPRQHTKHAPGGVGVLLLLLLLLRTHAHTHTRTHARTTLRYAVRMSVSNRSMSLRRPPAPAAPPMPSGLVMP